MGEVTNRMRPYFCLSIIGRAERLITKPPVRLTSSTRRQSSSRIMASTASRRMPALLTRMSKVSQSASSA